MLTKISLMIQWNIEDQIRIRRREMKKTIQEVLIEAKAFELLERFERVMKDVDNSSKVWDSNLKGNKTTSKGES